MKLRASDGHRWAFMRRHDIPDLLDTSKTYLSRLRIIQTPWFGLYLHRIDLPDGDRDLHDHPWPFVSTVGAGLSVLRKLGLVTSWKVADEFMAGVRR